MTHCITMRWRLSRAYDRGGTLPAALAQHLETCEACRQFHNRWSRAAQQLTAEPSPETPPYLHTRIMAGVREATAEREADVRHWKPMILSAATALLLVAGTVIGLLHAAYRTRPDPARELAEVRAYGEEAGAIAHQASLAVTQPLETELRNLQDDLGRARDFLAACLK